MAEAVTAALAKVTDFIADCAAAHRLRLENDSHEYAVELAEVIEALDYLTRRRDFLQKQIAASTKKERIERGKLFGAILQRARRQRIPEPALLEAAIALSLPDGNEAHRALTAGLRLLQVEPGVPVMGRGFVPGGLRAGLWCGGRLAASPMLTLEGNSQATWHIALEVSTASGDYTLHVNLAQLSDIYFDTLPQRLGMVVGIDQVVQHVPAMMAYHGVASNPSESAELREACRDARLDAATMALLFAA